MRHMFLISGKVNIKLYGTYRARNKEPREEVPDVVECRRDNGGYLVIWREANSHHAVKCEVEQCEVHEEEVPEEFGSSPLKSNHCIHYYPIYGSLN